MSRLSNRLALVKEYANPPCYDRSTEFPATQDNCPNSYAHNVTRSCPLLNHNVSIYNRFVQSLEDILMCNHWRLVKPSHLLSGTWVWVSWACSGAHSLPFHFNICAIGFWTLLAPWRPSLWSSMLHLFLLIVHVGSVGQVPYNPYLPKTSYQRTCMPSHMLTYKDCNT